MRSTRMNRLAAMAFLLLTALGTARSLAAEPAKPALLEAETFPGTDARVYRDARASGGKCTVLALQESSAGLFFHRKAMPAGDYLVTFWMEAQPAPLLHALRVTLRAGAATRVVRQIDLDGLPLPAKGVASAPEPGYQPFSLRVTHPGGDLAVSIEASLGPTPEGIRIDNTEEEKKENKKAAPMEDDGLLERPRAGGAGGGASGGKGKGAKREAEMDLEAEPSIERLTRLDKRLACDRVELLQLNTPPAVVARVEVDKVHYFPDETVKATVRIAPGAGGGTYRLVAEDVTEVDEARQVFAGEVRLEAGQPVEKSFEYSLKEGPFALREFGHELRCSLLPPGPAADAKPLHSRSEFFGVSENVYRIAISGSDAVGQDKAKATLEVARAGMLRNKANYANHFEQFAWAPCSYSNLTPQTEEWYSGQTQYHNTKTGMKLMIDEAHRVGVKVMTYGYCCGGGIAGLENYLRHPEIFASGVDGFGIVNTYLIERAHYNEYRFSDVTGTLGWRFWLPIYCASNQEAVDWGADQLIGSAKMFGWDGVRWDQHFAGDDPKVRAKIKAAFPRYVFGYNQSLAKPGSPVYLPPVKSRADFHDIAKNHGLIMDESVRLWQGPVRDLYEGLAREADYIKRIGGMPLMITFDNGSPQDGCFDVLSALAAGERYTYNNSPGDFAFGPMPRFLTRYSAFVWDDTARIAKAGEVVSVKVGRGPAGAAPWHDESTWLRKLPDGRQQLLVNLLNPPNYPVYLNRVQNPPSTLYDVAVSVPTPAGARLTRALHLSPDLVEGHVALPIKEDAGKASVTLPRLRNWSIVLFEYAPADAKAPLPYPAFKLTTPVEDADAAIAALDKEKIAKEQQAARVEAGLEIPKGATPEKPYYFDYEKSYDIDAEAGQKLVRPFDPAVRRDGMLDVIHCHGVFAWLNPVESAVGLAGGGNYNSAWENFAYWRGSPDGSLEDFPDTLEELLRYDVVVLDNLHARGLGPRKRAMLAEYVRNGGGLMIFAGVDNFSMGMDRNTALAALEPVEVVSRWNLARDDKGLPLTPAKPGFFSPGIRWNKNPQVYCLEQSPLRPGVEVVAKAGDRPAIVTQSVGKGRVVAVLFNPIGNYGPGSLPYFKWQDWPRMIADCVTWAAGDYKSTYVVKLPKAELNPKEVNPDDLAIESAMLPSAELTKKLRSAKKNMVDPARARTVLSIALDNAEKVDDQALILAIVDAAGPFLDASFSPLAKKMLSSQHAMLRRSGYKVLGLASDKSLHTALEGAMETEDDLYNQRAALVALGRLRMKESIPAVRRYVSKEKNTEKLLAWGVLKRLGDEDALQKSLSFYDEGARKALAMRCAYWAGFEMLNRGSAARLTAAKRRLLNTSFETTVQALRNIDFDVRYYLDSLAPFTDPERAVLADYLREAQDRSAGTLAYFAIGRLPEAQAKELCKKLADAKFEALRALAAE